MAEIKVRQIERIKSELSKLEAELAHLLTVKAEKLANEVLQKRHTQLSYLSEYDKEVHRVLSRRAVLNMLVNQLSKI
jgi:hypothetical protein